MSEVKIIEKKKKKKKKKKHKKQTHTTKKNNKKTDDSAGTRALNNHLTIRPERSALPTTLLQHIKL